MLKLFKVNSANNKRASMNDKHACWKNNQNILTIFTAHQPTTFEYIFRILEDLPLKPFHLVHLN